MELISSSECGSRIAQLESESIWTMKLFLNDFLEAYLICGFNFTYWVGIFADVQMSCAIITNGFDLPH